jgi:uracil-DNA glycosylase
LVRPDGPIPARLMIVGEAPGVEEERVGVPFVGPSGAELGRMLGDAGMGRGEAFVTNVARIRPANNDISTWFGTKTEAAASPHSYVHHRGKYVKQPIMDGCALLEKEIKMVQPNVIVALGNTALWALTGLWGIQRWRGSMLHTDTSPATKVIPTYHPAAILRQWEWRATAVHDLRRASEFRDGRPYPDPGWRFSIRPDVSRVDEVLSDLLRRLSHEPLWLSCDIETRCGHIDCLGIAWDRHNALCIPFMSGNGDYWEEDQEVFIVRKLMFLLTHPNIRCIFQNGLYDMQYIYRSWHYIPRIVQDTMLSWHTAFAGLPKRLDFIASMLCEQYVNWKPDRSKQKEGG